MTGRPPPTFRVRMLELPLVLRERSRQHGADLLREMTLLRGGSPAASARVPARLLQLASELDAVYGPYTASSTEEMDSAVDRGEQTLAEVVYDLPDEAAAFVRHVADVLAEAERYCVGDDHLLTPPPPREVALYRSWAIDEVLRQHAGEAPTPWPVYAAAHGLT